jgi:hypothetical protein
MARAQHGEPEVAPSRSLSACQRAWTSAVVIALPPIPPVVAFDLFDEAKGNLAHVLALDRNHCVGQLADDLALLFFSEHILDNLNLIKRRCFLLLYPLAVVVACCSDIGRFSGLDTHAINGEFATRDFERRLIYL